MPLQNNRKQLIYFNYMEDLYGSALGSTIKAKELLNGLDGLGYTIHSFWRCGEKESTEKKPESCFRLKQWARIVLFTPLQVLKAFIHSVQEAKIVQTLKPDLLIIRLDAFRFSGLIVAKFFKIPLIIEADGACSYEWLTFHNGPHLWVRWLLFFEKCLLKHSDSIFVQSEPAKSYYIHTHRTSPGKITIITNGAHPQIEIPETVLNSQRQKYGIKPGDIVIGFSGSMHHWHGIDRIKTLILNLLAKYNRIKFMFVGGGGPETNSIHSQFAENERIMFTGAIQFDQMPLYLALFDIALVPYPPMELFYFSPVKLYEYMSAGLAIVAARIGQIQTVLTHNESGLLFTPGDQDELQTCIETLIKNPQLRSKLAANAQKIFYQQYTWAQKANELADLIERTLKPRNSNDQSTSTG